MGGDRCGGGGRLVFATGGCAWKSKSLGSDVNTGDGHLFAAELGVELSGMEFSGFYGLLPRSTTMDKNGYYAFATFTRGDGSVIDGSLFLEQEPLLRASLEGPIFAQFNRAPRRSWDAMRANMPNFFMVMDKLHIDPFTERFEVEFVLQGTVRGTGGLKVQDFDCQSSAPGLYIAGDDGLPGTGGVRLRPTEPAGLGFRDVERAVQSELWPLEKNALRSRATLSASLAALNTRPRARVGCERVRPAPRVRRTAFAGDSNAPSSLACSALRLVASVSRGILRVMQAPTSGFPKPPTADESPAQALVRLLEQHGLEESLREILAAIETRRQERQQTTRLALLEHLLDGQPPLTEAELAAVRDE